MSSKCTLLLSRSDIASILSASEYIDVVERAFRLHAEGKALKPGLLHIDSDEGEFHIKAGGLRLDKTYFGLKSNAGFFQNKKKYGLPNIQGLIILCDGDKGSPLAVCDSTEITIQRTGAATAVAAKYLARGDSKTVTICGCGTQGRIQLRALKEVMLLEKAFAVDQDPQIVQDFIKDMPDELGISVLPGTLEEAVSQSDICVTCTLSKSYFLKNEFIPKGSFVAAVGADSPDKQELEPRVLSENKVVADILKQCVSVGEIHHAIAEGSMTAENVYGEIGEIISGKKPGRTSDDETIVYDSTGTALQDTAAAAAVYEKAISANKGTWFEFSK
jgi:ornithine cyclodeaminase/alanine dehydrogenase